MESLRLSDLHGSRLTADDSDGERYVVVGFTCDEYPDCDECGHISEENTDVDDGSKSQNSDNSFEPEHLQW